LSEIEKLKPDLVAIGARGLNVFSKILLGSVSEHLVHHVECPVVVVPKM
jgi:nucleotide-binding universal stress UspA family protein